ncbi:hypothetical protein ACHHYP_13944 [Achlya hypogyna]|uniref:Secreted protein n=1 Tax=Achlya hypogyna TaxID=1202772 RepID=A0A1V9YEF8_ACHHY|nr:hypothetical protein ACHHYP_13944 [Achlya hypogyna]
MVSFLACALLVVAAAALPFDGVNNSTKPTRIGLDYALPPAPTPRLVYEAPLDDTTAEFLSVRIAAFAIPDGDHVMIRAVNASVPQVYTYTNANASATPFFAVPIFGQHMRVQVYSAGGNGTFYIDSYRFSGTPGSSEADCTPGLSALPPTCNKAPQLPFFRGAQAVARLLINGPSGVKWCTGWLVGCQNHILTNYHCVGSQAEASATTFDFHAYSPVCAANACATAGACPGSLLVHGGDLIAASYSIDYALIQLNAPVAKGNYLKLQNFTSVGGGPIYIPQHPLGEGMLVGIKTPSAGNGQVLTSSYANCGMDGLLGYQIATAPGSSGSPIISQTNVVVGMHACGGPS